MSAEDQVFGGRGGDLPCSIHEPDGVCPPQCKVKLMRGDQYALPQTTGKGAKHRRDLQTGRQVKVRRRLIEEDERSLLG